MTRRAAWGGVAGPVAFIAAWAVLGSRTPGYASTEDAISRLAAVGADTRVAMSGGLVGLGAGLLVYAGAADRCLSRATAATAAGTAVSAFAVAALPLGGPAGDAAHGVAAGIGYVTLAATPLLGAAALRRFGHGRAARASVVVGAASALALAGSVLAPSRTGLLQRSGLTIGHAWIAASAVWILRRERICVGGTGLEPATPTVSR